MANLLIAIIGIVFAAALATAGISYLNPSAFVEHRQATAGTSQIEALAADYQNLSMNLGHRPTAADYAAQYPKQSANSQYSYSSAGSSTTVTTNADQGNTAGVKWTFVPGCGTASNGTVQDCFCTTISDGSDLTYKAAKMSALSEMDSTSLSRVEYGSSCSGSNNVTDPHAWPAAAPANGYTLTLRMQGGTPSAATATPFYSYNPVPVTTCPLGCGQSIPRVLVSWSCVRSDGQTVAQSYCASGPPTDLGTCQDTTYCSVQGAAVVSGYGPCIGGVQTLQWNCYANGVKLNSNQCTPPPNLTQTCGTSNNNNNYTYAVSNAQYGTCTAACGSSTAPVASWTCVRSDGTTVSQSDCTSAGVTPAATQACTSYATCVASSPVYGTCSATCGTGTAPLVSYTCADLAGNSVASSNCPSPAKTQACTSTTSCTYTANASTYGTCTPACGSSVAAAGSNWTCMQSDGTSVSQSVCLAHGVSPTSQACTNYSLCTPENVVYSPTCSNTCGTGTEALQSWTCGFLAQTASQSQCTAPAATQACTGYSGCSYTASNPTAYGSCSTTCGTGTQTATAFTCTRSDGTVVAQSNCTAPTTSCTSTSQCVLHNSYGPCSATCGAGTQTLKGSTCTDSNGNSAPTADCKTPPSTLICTSTSGCSYVAGLPSAWGACSTTCGVGTQTATTYPCTRSDGTSEPQGDCTAPVRACTSTTQCIPHASYGSCSSTCGTGTQVLLPGWTCTDSTGNAAPALNYCTAPIGIASCTVTSGCSYTASNPTAYGSCSTTCGTGTQTATAFTCTRSDGTSEPLSACTAPTKSCSSNTGCVATPTYGACNTTCGTGTQTLTSWTCDTSGGSVVTPASTYCPTPPASSESCTATSGCTYTASGGSNWGACSTTCGTGTQTAGTFTCKRSDGTVVAASNCTAPTQSCTSTSQCVVHASYGACNATCGAGTEALNSSWTCTDANGNAAPTRSDCTAPAGSMACSAYTGCTYAASAPTAWGACSSTCGTGTQTATAFTCTRSDGTLEPDSYCTAPTEACTDYSSCTFTYQPVNYSYSNTCAPADCGAPSHQELASWQCERFPDGTIVDNSYCVNNQPPPGPVCYNYSSCYTYTSSNPTYGACVASCNGSTPVGTATLPTATDPVLGTSYYDGFTCTRSDGVIFSGAGDAEQGCQALVGSSTLPASISCTPTTPATCH